MKRKLLALLIFIFGICGTLGYFNLQTGNASAISLDTSVWDGRIVTNANDLTSADFYDDNATEYYIRSAKGFSYFAYLVNNGQTFKSETGFSKIIHLETDLDFDGHVWTPIGNSVNVFQGRFNGEGHSIYNMKLSTTQKYTGLFGYVGEYGRIEGVHLKNCEVEVKTSSSLTDYYVGALVGQIKVSNSAQNESSYGNTYIQNCSAIGTMSVDLALSANATAYIGGTVGQSSNGKLVNIKSSLDVDGKIDSSSTSSTFSFGSVLGAGTHASLYGCYSESEVNVKVGIAGDIGGLVGSASAMDTTHYTAIYNSYNFGEINVAGINDSVTQNIAVRTGGLVGRVLPYQGSSMAAAYFAIKNCYNASDINYILNTRNGSVGGLVGFVPNTVVKNSVSLLDSFNFGAVNAEKLKDYQKNAVTTVFYTPTQNRSSMTLKGLYSTNAAECYLRNGQLIDEKSATAALGVDFGGQLNQLARTAGFYNNIRYWSQTRDDGSGEEDSWDFNLVWRITAGINTGLPYIRDSYNAGNPNNDDEYSTTNPLKGSGTAESPYLIETAADLGWVSFNYASGKYYALQNDIDLSGKTWQPIGSIATPFSAVFDGNNHSIYGLTCSLQETFSYHGLFGVTENAVIKNLQLRQADYIRTTLINPGSQGQVGSFIGLVKGNTYIVNCIDTSNAEYTLGDETVSVNPVGKVSDSATLYVFYGKNNTSLIGNIVKENFDLSKTEKGSNANIYYGYDIAIDGVGGNFYKMNQEVDQSGKVIKTTKTLYRANYHLLVLPQDSKYKNMVWENGNSEWGSEDVKVDVIIQKIDSTFGASLPQLSTTAGDVVIKKGFKAKSYVYTANNEVQSLIISTKGKKVSELTLNFTIGNSVTSGLSVTWENNGFDPDNPGKVDPSTAIQVKVVYNAYELGAFTPKDEPWQAYNYHANSLVKVDTTGSITGIKNAVYKIFYAEYDSNFSDYENEDIRNIPQYIDANGQTKVLRNGDFTFTKGANGKTNLYESYSSSSFGDLIEDETVEDIINENKIVFVDWQGTSEEDKQFVAKFEKATSSEVDQKFAGDFDLNEAIDSIEFISSDEEKSVSASNVSLENNQMSFSFNTLYSAKSGDWLKLKVKLNEGYNFSSSVAGNYGSEVIYDTNFGVLKSEIASSIDGDSVQWKEIKYTNLIGDYSTLFAIRKQLYTNEVTIGAGVYFGLSPMISNWKNVAIKSKTGVYHEMGAVAGSNQSFNSTFNTDAENKYVGVDFKNKRIMTSFGAYDSVDITDYFIDNCVMMRYTLNADASSGAEERYFAYKYITYNIDDVEHEFVYLYEVDVNGVELTEIARLMYGDSDLQYTLEYYTKSTFAMIFTTEADTTEFNNFSTFAPTDSNPNGSAKTSVKKRNGSGNTTKFIITFEDIIELTPPIVASTRYTQAYFTFNVRYLNADGQIVDFGSEGAPAKSRAPKLSRKSGVYSVSSDKDSDRVVEFDIISTSYYRFFVERSGQNNATLYNADNYAGLVSKTADNYNLRVNVSYTNPVGAYANLDFNNYNGVYLKASCISISGGGYTLTENGDYQYDYAKYTITFRYDRSESTYGLVAGHYDVEILCTDVLYELSSETRFIKLDDTLVDANGNVDTEKFTKDATSKIVTVANKTENIKYDDAIELNTYMDNTNVGYSFYGWYIKGANYERVIQKDVGVSNTPLATNKATIGFAYSQNYLRGFARDNENSKYKIVIYAIYQRKEMSITLSESVVIYEENGTTTSPIRYAGNLGLSGIGFSWNGYIYDTLKYTYFSGDESASANYTQFSNASLVKNGDGRNLGYYYVGFRLYGIDGEIVKDANGDKIEVVDWTENDVDVYSILKQKIEKGQTANSQNYILMPILRQKTAIIDFNSGTGNTAYGDKKANGIVKGDTNDESDVVTTEKVFKLNKVYFGTSLYLNFGLNGLLDNESVSGLVVDDLFKDRIGYTTSGNNFWAWTNASGTSGDTIETGNRIDLLENYFLGDSNEVTLHFYRLWTPNTYYVTFYPNGGNFKNVDTVSVEVEYDTNVYKYKAGTYSLATLGTIQDLSSVARIGYRVDSWSLKQDGTDVVLDREFSIVNIFDIFDSDENFVKGDNIILYANWVEKPYKIQIALNSANSYSVKDGEQIDIEEKEQQTFVLDLYLDYDSTFENLSLDDEKLNILKLSELLPKREGFVFDGIYAVSGRLSEEITDETIFNNQILSCDKDMAKDVVLTLYARWIFDENYLDLTLNSTTLPALTYTGSSQTVYLAEYFNLGYNEDTKYIISTNENNLSITLTDSMHAKIETVLSSNNATVSSASDMNFKVKNAGWYWVNFTIEVVDKALYLNGGNVFSTNFELYITVNKANLSFEISDKVYLENAKRMMSGFVSATMKAQLDACTTLEGFASLMKANDETISNDVEVADIYNFVMTKYYYMSATNDGSEYRTYKEWNYASYIDYLTENADSATQLLEQLKFFAYYDHSLADTQMTVDGYDEMQLVSDTVESIKSELLVSSAIMSSGTISTMKARNSYDFRIYLQNNDAITDYLANYEVLYDNDDNAYLYIGRAYLMPEQIVLQNLEQVKNAYFEAGIENKQVDWQGKRDVLAYDDETYYSLVDDLYIKASVYTSAPGNKDIDTKFSFTNDENYLYITGVMILQRVISEGATTYQNVSSYFDMIMDESDVFTILNTKGVANLTFDAKYLTNDNGSIEFETIQDAMASGLLRITRVNYTLRGVSKNVYASNGLDEGSYSDNGVLIYQIAKNNANTVSVFINQTVTSVVVSTISKDINDYIGLYKWIDNPIYNIDGTMENQTTYVVNKSDITLSQDGLTSKQYYAVYTDLVLVKYNLNFPANYTPSTATSSVLRLGYSTVSDLNMPQEKGFSLASLKAKTPTGETVDYRNIFTGLDSGNGSVFEGITSDTRHAIVNLEAKWFAEEMQYEQLLENYVTAVKSFDSLSVSEVVRITNQNTDIYDYTYEWYFGDTKISNEEILKLKEQGSSAESGIYKLVVVATMNAQFAVCLEDSANTSSRIEVEFSLEFKKHIIDKIVLPEEKSVTITYDALDHMNDWEVEVDYFLYDRIYEKYSENATVQQLHYVTTGSIYFKAFFNGGEVSTIKNAGTYRIMICFDEDIFDLTGVEENQKQFIFTINPSTVDLAAYDFSTSKNFNGKEKEMTKEISLKNEVVELKLSRTAGEDVGKYDIFLQDIIQDYKKNYIFKLGDVTLFEDGVLTADGQTTPIGKFEIKSSGILRLAYEVTAQNPMHTEVAYSAEGYTINLTNDFKLQIFNGTNMIKEFTLTLFDVSAGEYVENETILNLLKAKAQHISAKFFNNEYFDKVVDSNVYTYAFVLDEEMQKYYSYVEFAQGYQFTNGKIVIDVSKINLQKVYNGQNVGYFDLSLNAIDLNDFESGIYIVANYATAHVGTNIKVGLELLQKNSTENLSNYALSSSTALGEITKLKATLAVELTNNSYTYGQVSLGNVAQLVKSFTVVDDGGKDVTSLLASGYYMISYKLPNSISTNERGFVYKGNYQLQVEGEFKDFDMTTTNPSFEIVALNVTKAISSSYIQISVLDKVKDFYEEDMKITETGDTINLKLKPNGLTAGSYATTGLYDLALVETTFASGSIEVSITANNQGFEVLPESVTLYAKIDDTTIFNKQYNGQNYVLSVDKSNLKIGITNGSDVFESTLSFYTKSQNESGEEVENSVEGSGLTFSVLSIFTAGNLTTMKNAGNYKLYISASCGQYPNVVFANEYTFAISKKTIDISQFDFVMTYNNETSYIIEDFNEKVTSDNATILVKFEDSSAEANKNVSLYLNGQDVENYVLSAQTSIGEILKAQAVARLTETSVVYGSWTKLNAIGYSISSNGRELMPSEYTVDFEIQNPNYSGMDYLQVGTYSVVMKNYTSANYEIAFESASLTVTVLSFDIRLETSGQFVYYYGSTESLTDEFVYEYTTSLYETVSITYTRKSGTNLGYYKVLGGTVNDNANYRLNKVDDASPLGAFRIIYAKEKLYMLIGEDDEVTDGGTVAQIDYDGNLYDSIRVAERETAGTYKLVISNSANASINKEFNLSFYVYDSTTKIYSKVNAQALGLSTNIEFMRPSMVKTVGSYDIYASGTTSSTYEVKLGKESTIYCYSLKIEKRQLYFKQDSLSKVFDNKDATFEYDDAKEILTNIVSSENMSLSIKFTKDGKVARYAGVGYTVEATIYGDTITNYQINYSTEDNVLVLGQITRADMWIVIDNQTYVYGDNYTLRYKLKTDVDLTDYDMSRISVSLRVPGSTALSTSGALKVGEYSLNAIFNAEDFSHAGYIVDNREQETLTAKLTITPKQLELVKKTTELSEIFTKIYDGDNTVDIIDDLGELLFGFSGIHSSDDGISDAVTVVSANYASEYVGQAIQVSFVLGGEDKENYTLSPWLYGVIRPIIINLEFNYNADGQDVHSNVDDNKLPTLSQLSFPFMSNSYLTANSAVSSTNSIKNFPTSLAGKTGYSFLYWTMDFENVENASTKLSALQDLVSTYGLEGTFDGDNQTYSIKVDNGEKTVRFLNALILDERDLFGLYYKSNTNPSIIFNANWGTNKLRVTILIADADGKSAQYGTVEVTDSTGKTTVKTNFLKQYDYNSTLTLKATAVEHCYFGGFYSADGNLYTGSTDDITINYDEDGKPTLTILNIKQEYNFVVRFKTQNINVVMDLSEYDDATIDSTDFVSIGNNKYQWSTDYMTLKTMFVSSLPEVTRLGYEVTGLKTRTATILKTNYATAKIIAYLPSSTDETIEVSFKPIYEAVGVVVTLDYAYDSKTVSLTVPYGKAYKEATNWEETPTRDGYEFLGWFDDDGNRIVGNDILATTLAHTLTARWNLLHFDIKFISPNATIESNVISFTKEGDNYTATGIDFGATIEFVVTPNAGYEISAAWASEYSVVINEDGSANITLVMPSRNIEYTLPVVPITNHISVVATNLLSMQVFDVTDEQETQITLAENMFDIETGRKVKFVLTPKQGYALSEDVLASDNTGLVITPTLSEDGVLTVVVEGINKSITITFTTVELKNKITLSFDDVEVVDRVEVEGKSYTDIANLTYFEAKTDSTFVFFVRYKHGYGLDSCQSNQFTVTSELVMTGVYTDYYRIEVTEISTDGSVSLTSTLFKFTLSVESISYDENKNRVDIAGNIALVNGETSVSVDYKETVTLSYQVANLYSFAGWSKDGISIFSTDENLEYEVTQNETIYAIFSTLKFHIEFSTYNYYTIYNEYNDASKVETVYSEIYGSKFIDADTNQKIDPALELYYGASKDIKVEIPKGYTYYGYGYRKDGNFIYLGYDDSGSEDIVFNISTLALDEDMVQLRIYVVVRAESASIKVKTNITIDGTREEDVDVGSIAIQDKLKNDVNRYGYLDGTRIHYTAASFENGELVSNKNFEVVAYTGDIFYIKARILKKGYKFAQVVTNREDIQVLKTIENDEYIMFEVRDFVGGTADFEIEILFKPTINIINLSFKNNNKKVSGGAFTLKVEDNATKKVWTSGQDYTSMTISAYTDSSFEVSVYIRAGYYVDKNNVQITDASGIIVSNSITFEELSVTDTGYTGKIMFSVADYLGTHEISVAVTPLTYTILLKEDSMTLAKIKHVKFDSLLDLNESNAENVEITDTTRIFYLNGRLKLNFVKERHNFEGFFTYQNGVGVRYINSDGNAENEWEESGYVLNPLTSKYQYSENVLRDELGNVVFDSETGELTLNLYLYMSYLKTRISFEFVPNISTTHTAQDMVSGVDYTNSWFYSTAPLYIEVSFNTDIHIKAPQISGYKFYKFIISQKNADGTWLTDVNAYLDDIPWSTNEYDKIVECKVKVVYFAQVDVKIFGGEGIYTIRQDATDTQAKTLLQEGYIDTSKPFTVEAKANSGYEFMQWTNATTGQISFDETITVSSQRKVDLIMRLRGKTATLNFEDYDTTFGQIMNLKMESLDNSIKNVRLGGFSGTQFIKLLTEAEVRVGDKVTFMLNVDYGFSIIWDSALNMSFVEYSGNTYYFAMTITAEMAGQALNIIPQFKDEILSVYVSSSFAENTSGKEPVDFDLVSMAGYVTYDGKKVSNFTAPHDQNIRIVTVTNARYKISRVIIKNYDRIFDDMTGFFNANEEIILTTAYMQEKGIVGNIQVEIEYKRVLWEDDLIEVDEFEGSGTSKSPYQIKTVQDLILMQTLVNSGARNARGIEYRHCQFILMNDLDLTEKFWTPIGTESYSFNGVFNFNNHKIAGINLAYYYSPIYYNGLFGYLGSSARIIAGETSYWYVYLIVAIVLLIAILLVILILLNRKKKKRREELSTK